MSYILDALKRADAERERGAVPGLHARQVTTPTSKAARGAQGRRWLAGATVLTLGCVAAAWWFWQTPASVVRPLAALPVAPPPVSVPLPVPLAPTMPAPAPAPVAAAPLAPALTSVPNPATQAAPAVAASVPAVAASLPVVIRAAPAVVPLLSDLSEDIRQRIPALVITGAVYSENPAQRLLLVNNLVLTQGSQVTPELILEEIRAKSSVFSFRDTRFRLTH